MEAAEVPEVSPEQARWDENWEETVGGKSPTGRRLSVQSVSTEDVPRDLKKGQTIELRVVAQIRGNGGLDKTDSKTGQVVDCTQVLTAVAKSVQVVRTVEAVQ